MYLIQVLHWHASSAHVDGFPPECSSWVWMFWKICCWTRNSFCTAGQIYLQVKLIRSRVIVYKILSAERRVWLHNLLTFLLAAVEPLTNVLCSFPFRCSLKSVTIPKLNSFMWSIVSLGYWHPRNSIFPKVCANPTCNTILTVHHSLVYWQHRTDQLWFWESVFVMLHELLLQLPVVLGLMRSTILLNIPVLIVSHLKVESGVDR